MKPTQNMIAEIVALSHHCSSQKAARAVVAILWAPLFAVTTAALAQTPDSIAEREVHRRQAAIPDGEAALARGKSALKARNYTVAYQEFKTAIGYLPDAVRSEERRVGKECRS